MEQSPYAEIMVVGHVKPSNIRSDGTPLHHAPSCIVGRSVAKILQRWRGSLVLAHATMECKRRYSAYSNETLSYPRGCWIGLGNPQ